MLADIEAKRTALDAQRRDAANKVRLVVSNRQHKSSGFGCRAQMFQPFGGSPERFQISMGRQFAPFVYDAGTPKFR
jgi:hypothetical protein